MPDGVTVSKIIEPEAFRALVAVLSDKSRDRRRGGVTRSLLGGLVRCLCGEPMFSARDRDGRRIYKCATKLHPGAKPDGPHVQRKADPVDDYVVRLVVGRLSMPDAVNLIPAAEDGPDVDALRSEGRVLRAELDEMARDLSAPYALVRKRSEAVTARLEAIDAQLIEAAQVSVLATLVGVDDVRAAWDGMDLDRQRAAVDTLFTVRLDSPGRGAHARVFRPETVIIEWHT